MESLAQTQLSTDVACVMGMEAVVCQVPEEVWHETAPASRKPLPLELLILLRAPWNGLSIWGMMLTGEVKLPLLKAPLRTQRKTIFIGLWSSLAVASRAEEVFI